MGWEHLMVICTMASPFPLLRSPLPFLFPFFFFFCQGLVLPIYLSAHVPLPARHITLASSSYH